MTPEEAIKELHLLRSVGGIVPQKRAEMIDFAISAIKEVHQYREIGTVEEIKSAKKYIDLKKRCGTSTNTAEYVAIGTVEECREAMDKQIPKNPKDELKISPIIDENEAYVDADMTVYLFCPNCGEMVGIDENIDKFCRECGQAIDTENLEEKE